MSWDPGGVRCLKVNNKITSALKKLLKVLNDGREDAKYDGNMVDANSNIHTFFNCY